MRKFIIVWLALVFSLTSITSVSASSSQSYHISINGQVIESDASPINRNGSIFVPMRAIFEALKAKVSYSPSEQKVVGIRGNTTLEMWIGRNDAYLNGERITMQQAPFMQSNRVYVPVRVISEALGAHVKWNKSKLTVEVESSLLSHRDELPAVNDQDQAIVLEHKGNMRLKWSYQDESPFQMFDGYVAGEDKYIFKGFQEAYVMNGNGDVKETWDLTENNTSSIKAYYFTESKTAKVVSSNPVNTWNSIPLLRLELNLSNPSPISIQIFQPIAVIDSSGNLIITTTEGLTAYAPNGNKLWSHMEWTSQDQTISAQQYAFRMLTDDQGRLYIFYMDGTVILDKNGKLLTAVDYSYFNLYPMKDGRILHDRGVYDFTENGDFKPVYKAAITNAENITITEESVTSLGASESDVHWSYQLPNYELNKGQRIYESSLTMDLYGNTYFSTQDGSVYAFDSKGELLFKLIVDQRTISVSEIIPISEHRIIIVNNNAFFFFEIE